ncbi:MAG: TonB C-terminal domain-containing protein [Betaproteobacteria bacterium]|nr:TonB C-terminal domain-containing protein [Betaproteobacteria bacterium]
MMQQAAALSHPADTRYAEPGQKPAAVLAVLVHVLLFVFLVFGLRWSAKVPDAVMVELWTQPAVGEPMPKAEPEPEPRAEPPPKPAAKLEPPTPAPKVEAPVRKPDIVIEKDKKPARREEPKLQIDARARIQEQLARETQALAQERQKATPPVAVPASPMAPAQPASAPVIDPGYANRIRQRIKGNIAVPDNISGNPEAIFDVIQLPTGEVLSVKLLKSSGFPAFDDAVERAILKSSPLPLPLPRPDIASQIQRQLELRFRPKEP